MFYIIGVIFFFVLGVFVATKMEKLLLRRGVSRGVTDGLTFVSLLFFLLVGFFTSAVFDYQLGSAWEMGSLYVENADGGISKPFFGSFHKPFTPVIERRSFRFSPGPYNNADREVTFVSMVDNQVRILSFRMTWQYTIDPKEYRRLQKAGAIGELPYELGSKLTLEAFRLKERQPELVRDLLFSVRGSQGSRLTEAVCEAIPSFMQKHLQIPVPWIEVGEPVSCWLSTLE